MVGLAVGRNTVQVCDYRRYPDGIKSQVLNIVEVLNQATPCATTIFPFRSIAMGTIARICGSEAVCYDLKLIGEDG